MESVRCSAPFLILETCQTSKLELLNQIWCIVINGIQDDSSVSHEYLLEIYYRRTRYQIHTLTHKKFQALLVAVLLYCIQIAKSNILNNLNYDRNVKTYTGSILWAYAISLLLLIYHYC